MSSDDSQGSGSEREPKEERAEALFAEYLGQLESGDVDFDSFCAKHADLATEVRALHDHWQKVRSVLDRLSPANTVADSIRSRYGSDADPGVTLEKEGDVEADFSSEILGRLAGRTGAFGRYRLKGEVARGGMGVILRVWDEDLRRNLAMKVILGQGEAKASGQTPPVDSRVLSRFLEEAQVTGQLDHPGIVPVYELGVDSDGRVYFTMQLVRGRNFQKILELVQAGEEDWTFTRALGVLLKVCEAMAYAHDKGVIHRDLKPANIMVGRFGEVYVMDWGLARVMGREDKKDIRIKPLGATSEVRSDRRDHGETPDSPLITMDGDVVGTPAYMSPEQARGELDQIGPQSDVYSIGAVLYDLLAGHMPYVKPGVRINNYAIWSRVQEGPPRPIGDEAGDAAVEVVAICEKAMARKPGERYPDTSELAEDIRSFLEGTVVRAHKPNLQQRIRRFVAHESKLGIVGVGLLIIGQSLITLAVTAGSDVFEGPGPAVIMCSPSIIGLSFMVGSLFQRQKHKWVPAAAVGILILWGLFFFPWFNRNRTGGIWPTDLLLCNYAFSLVRLDPDDQVPEAAVMLASKAVEISPLTSMYWSTLGLAYHRNADFREAIGAIEKAIELAGKPDVTNGFVLALAYHDLGESEKALECFEQASRLARKDPDSRSWYYLPLLVECVADLEISKETLGGELAKKLQEFEDRASTRPPDPDAVDR